MFETISPEKAGISSRAVLDFLKSIEAEGFCTHSLIMARGDRIFAEAYFAPFQKETLHRMYSVSKSFVGVAIGLAAEEGLLSLDDPFMKYFPEYLNDMPADLRHEATIRDLLTMETSVMKHASWFRTHTDDRVKVYFAGEADKIPGTLFHYDSPGSFMLGVIVKKVTGMHFLDYLKDRFLTEIGFSAESYCLSVPGGHAFGDSGVMCTARDLLLFARFVMNRGVWNGKRYMNEAFLREAAAFQVCNDHGGYPGYDTHGYGYQIWKTPGEGFAFIGMGDQFAICAPEKDFIFIINSDNQGASAVTRAILYHELFRRLIPAIGEPLPEDEEALRELRRYMQTRELFHLTQKEPNPFEKEIEGRTYRLEANPMEIRWLRLSFSGGVGILYFENKQGEKELKFGMGRNVFGLFPQEGYSDLVAGTECPGHRYRCACSADWPESRKLRIKVQIIDRYFGNACFVFSFKDDRVAVSMKKTAEHFLEEYEGIARGYRE